MNLRKWFAFVFLLVLAACGGGGGGGGNSPGVTPITIAWTNPTDPALETVQTANGDVVTYMGSKDANGIPTSLDTIQVMHASGDISIVTIVTDLTGIFRFVSSRECELKIAPVQFTVAQSGTVILRGLLERAETHQGRPDPVLRRRVGRAVAAHP
jgi:hypothetical protein